jgi:hypothetical protein
MTAKRFLTSHTFRFSIRQLLVWTAFVALACVALRNASPTWVAALLGATLLLLTAAVPLAIFRGQGNRAFWIGFALFGWLYMLALAYGWSLDPNKSDHNPLRPERLITGRVTSGGFDWLYGTEPPNGRQLTWIQLTADGAGALVGDPMNSVSTTDLSLMIAETKRIGAAAPQFDDFDNVAHAFWAILLAALGGWFTRWIYATRPGQRDTA